MSDRFQALVAPAAGAGTLQSVDDRGNVPSCAFKCVKIKRNYRFHAGRP
ncbi:hypothetical protein [Streptomyces sp. NPDC053560]